MTQLRTGAKSVFHFASSELYRFPTMEAELHLGRSFRSFQRQVVYFEGEERKGHSYFWLLRHPTDPATRTLLLAEA